MPYCRPSGIRDLSHRRRVLIVDDQPDAAELLAMLLAEQGHEVRIAHDGEAALALAAAFWPQIAILDISLVGMDGYDLARALRSRPAHSDCRLFALSGYGSVEHLARAERAGFERHFTKPVALQALAQAIRADGAARRDVGASG